MDQDQRRQRLESLFLEHAPAILAYARRRTDHVSAADVLSEVFVVACRRLDEVPADAAPWLIGCARRVMLNQARAERRRLRLGERLRAWTPRAPVELELPDGTLATALSSLGECDREVLLLTGWDGLSATQAARVLGCSPQAFWVRSHRARRRLAAALSEFEGSPAPLTMEACND
jgi:RNA polymerase sigma-70 factor, ECF subfamily